MFFVCGLNSCGKKRLLVLLVFFPHVQTANGSTVLKDQNLRMAHWNRGSRTWERPSIFRFHVQLWDWLTFHDTLPRQSVAGTYYGTVMAESFVEEVIIGRGPVSTWRKRGVGPFEGKAFLPNKSQVETWGYWNQVWTGINAWVND